MNLPLTSILYVCDQSIEKASELVTSCKNFKAAQNELNISLDYRVIMISLPNRPGMSEFMFRMKEILSKNGVEAESWIPPGDIIRDDIFYLIGSVQFMLSGYLVLHDIPLDFNQTKLIIKAARSVQFSNKYIYLKKIGFLKSKGNIGIFHESMLAFAFLEMKEHILKGETSNMDSFLKALKRAVKKEPKIKIKYFSC